MKTLANNIGIFVYKDLIEPEFCEKTYQAL